MLIRSHIPVSGLSGKVETAFPILPLMTGVLFPGTMLTIQVGRIENLTLIDEVLRSKKIKRFVASYSHTEVETATTMPIHEIGVFAEIRDHREGPGGSRVLTIEGVSRALIREITHSAPFLIGDVEEIGTVGYAEKDDPEKGRRDNRHGQPDHPS